MRQDGGLGGLLLTSARGACRCLCGYEVRSRSDELGKLDFVAGRPRAVDVDAPAAGLADPAKQLVDDARRTGIGPAVAPAGTWGHRPGHGGIGPGPRASAGARGHRAGAEGIGRGTGASAGARGHRAGSCAGPASDRQWRRTGIGPWRRTGIGPASGRQFLRIYHGGNVVQDVAPRERVRVARVTLVATHPARGPGACMRE